MTIPYTLDANEFTEEGGCFARMRSVGSADLEMIADRIVARGSTVGKADVLAVLYLLIEVCLQLILDGWRVHLGGLVKLYCSIEGVFRQYDDSFEPGRHKLKGVAQAGPRLNKVLRHEGKPRKQTSRRPHPVPQQFSDVSTGAHDCFGPGAMGRLAGWRLKFNPAADDEGLFLIDQTGGEQRLQVIHNTPKLLIFSLPQVAAGVCHLEVRARVGHASALRTSRLHQPLSVTESAP